MGIFDKKSSKSKASEAKSHSDAKSSAPVDQVDPRETDPYDPDSETVIYTRPPSLDSAAPPDGSPPTLNSDAESDAESQASSTATVSYGIEQAIALMRTLPSDRIELIVRIVKHTLESAHINIGAIIEDAVTKEKSIDEHIERIKGESATLSEKLDSCASELARLDKDRNETALVRERLQLAESLDQEVIDSAKATKTEKSETRSSNESK